MNGPRLFQANAPGSRPRINRTASPVLALSVPWFTVILASVVPTWFVIASTPVMPPFGFLFLLSWRQLRPGVFPVWAGLPLGLIDDIYSGQPMGSAILLWSIACIVLDIVETRLPWRNFATEWLVASGLIASYIILSLGVANLAGGSTHLFLVVPQIVISVLVYPLVGRLVAAFDRFRLLPIAEIG